MVERPLPIPASTDPGLRDLLVFHNVARALTSSLDRDAILRAIMQQMEQFFKPETWSLLLMDEVRRDLYYAVALGHTEEELRDMRVPWGHGLAGWVAEHGESLIVPEVSEDPRFDARFAAAGKTATAFHVRSAICMPLRSHQRTLGVIQLFNCRLDTLTDYTISFLHVLCDYAAIAIDNARHMERIQELSITDDCTGVYNVRHLYHVLEGIVEAPEGASRDTSPFSLIFIDLDHFKQVNDRHGHLVGSHLLKEVGETLRASLRKQDMVFRYGGDEFVAMLPRADKRGAQYVAERLIKGLRERKFGNVLALEVRASFGVATWPEDGRTIHQIIRSADAMMYLVKSATRDNIAIAGKGLIQPER
ncbi:MAG: sensor domain-containing diguanylate cyclase [Acidobacteriaceae bacterium]